MTACERSRTSGIVRAFATSECAAGEAAAVTSRAPSAVVVGPVAFEQLPICQQIRRTVFIEGQGVPESLEIDGLDRESTHFLIWMQGVPVGTARMRVLPVGAKAERVAVLPGYSGRGLGRRLMEALERQAAACGLTSVVLHAQEAVIPFYLKLGYQGEGARFEEAGIRHWAMSKHLESLERL